MKSVRFASILALGALASASPADIFNFTGTSSGITNTTTTFVSTQIPGISQSTSPFAVVTSGTVFLNDGVSTFTFGSAGNQLIVTFNAATDGAGGGATSYASAGVISGTGSFALYTGQTVAVASNTLPSVGFNTFSIDGNVQPTPEPSALVAMGLGALVLVKRRKRA